MYVTACMLRHVCYGILFSNKSQMEPEDMMEHLWGTSLWNICSLLPSTSFHFLPLRSTSVLVTLCAQEAVGHLLSGRFVTSPVTTVTPGFRLRTAPLARRLVNGWVELRRLLLRDMFPHGRFKPKGSLRCVETCENM